MKDIRIRQIPGVKRINVCIQSHYKSTRRRHRFFQLTARILNDFLILVDTCLTLSENQIPNSTDLFYFQFHKLFCHTEYHYEIKFFPNIFLYIPPRLTIILITQSSLIFHTLLNYRRHCQCGIWNYHRNPTKYHTISTPISSRFFPPQTARALLYQPTITPPARSRPI